MIVQFYKFHKLHNNQLHIVASCHVDVQRADGQMHVHVCIVM